MEFKIDYGTTNVTPRAPQDPTLYASIDGRASSLANGEVVFYDPETLHTHVMTVEVLQAMDACREFRTLDEQVERVLQTQPALKGQGEAVRRVLRGLVERGLLVSDVDFLARFRATETAPPLGAVDVYVRACDRPAQLQRLLASLLAYEKQHARGFRYVVVDDSTRRDAIGDHAALLREFGAASGCSTVHIDAERWQGIVSALGSQLPGHADALRAMLWRDPAAGGRAGSGIGKNLITLLSAGRRYLLLDDDFVFPLRRHPEYVPGLVFDARAWGIRTYADQATAVAAGDDPAFDPVEAHLRSCGASLSQIVGEPGFEFGREQLRGLAPARQAALRPDARAVLTVNGHRGASGSANLGWVYLLDAPGRAGMVRDRDTYVATHGDPQVWFGTRAHQVAAPGNFTPFAIDNRTLRPCTSPYGRSEDALFGALVQWSDPNAFEMNLPYSVAHVQEQRRDRGASLSSAETPDLNLCLAEMAREARSDLHARAPGQRLAMFAARMEDLGAASDRDAIAYLSEFLAYRRSALVEQLQATAERSADAPIYWGADLRQLVEANGKALIEPGAPRFAGWPADATAEECSARFRQETATLAQGIRAWPAAWEVALSENGRWLAT